MRRRGAQPNGARRPLRDLSGCSVALLVWAFVGVGCDGCLPKVEVESFADVPYPSCGPDPLPSGTIVGGGHLRAGPNSRDPLVVERFEVRRRDCLTVVTVRQEWPMGTADLELIYDEGGVPIRAWKRMTLPETDAEDVRRFDLGQESATMKVKDQGGELHYYRFRGPRPSAIIAPGRGALSPWIRRAQLAVGDATREWVLDMRGIGGEEIREVTLRRDPDRDETGLGQVRVYTVYGRESVFTDANGFVIGDLSGLRPHASLTTDPPPAILMASPPDPVHTP